MSLLGSQRLVRPSRYMYGAPDSSARHATCGSETPSQLSAGSFSQSQDDGTASASSRFRAVSNPNDADKRALRAIAKRVSDHEQLIRDQSVLIKQLGAKLDQSLTAQAQLRELVQQERSANNEIRTMPETMRTLVGELRQQLQVAQSSQVESTRSMINSQFAAIRASLTVAPPDCGSSPAASSPPAQPFSGGALAPFFQSTHSTPPGSAAPALHYGHHAQHDLAYPPYAPPPSFHSPHQPSSAQPAPPAPSRPATVGRKRRLLTMSEASGRASTPSTPGPACTLSDVRHAEPDHHENRSHHWSQGEEEEEEDDYDDESAMLDRGPPAEAFDLFAEDGPPSIPPISSPPPAAACSSPPPPPSAASSHYTPASADFSGAATPEGVAAARRQASSRTDSLPLAIALFAASGAASGGSSCTRRSVAPSDSERRDCRLEHPGRREALKAMGHAAA
jgi:hypothetical protein